MNTRTLSLSVVGDAVTSFQDTAMGEETSSPIRVSTMELSGQLAGDLGDQLTRLTAQAGDAKVVRTNCALLMRVDFVAAGDLLNWVTQRQAEGREIVFMETHRLVALMFGAMGITEHARVQLRTN
jgi:ABC-type transporter Mla MlaB component